jgi:hypothetical protein
MQKPDNTFTQIGITQDDKLVVDGVWKMYETHGLSLDTIFTCLKEKNAMPCWISLYRQMRLSGMKHERIIAKLEADVSDSFGATFSESVIERLNNIFNQKEKEIA